MLIGNWTENVPDTELRRLLLALGSLQERTAGAFDRFVSQIVNISDRYPDLLIRRDRSPENIRDGLVCDAEGMRASQAFKNQLFGNIGRQSALLNLRQEELELLRQIDARLDRID